MEAKEIEDCIDLFGTEIYRFCIKLCQDTSNAEDLYQQTFLKALESDMTINWEQNPKSLFFSIAFRLWKSEQRKIARRSNITPMIHITEDNENMIKSDENIEKNIYHQELIKETNKIIETLPDKLRIPIILYYLFEQPVEQVAKQINKPPGTVKSRLFKGRKIIKQRLEELGYENQEL